MPITQKTIKWRERKNLAFKRKHPNMTRKEWAEFKRKNKNHGD